MVTKEEAAELLKRMSDSRPKKLFKNFDKTNAGIGCVMNCLFETEKSVSAGEISQFMNVSTARVAVLLRKMTEKGLIDRTGDPDDARKSMISLSEKGREIMEKHRESFLVFFSSVIERMGKERFEEFISMSEELRDALEAEADSCGMLSGECNEEWMMR